MATAIDDLRAFHEFVGRKLAECETAPPTPQNCLDLWLIENPSPEEEAATLEAIREGFADLAAGRVRPVEDVLRELHRRHELREEVR